MVVDDGSHDWLTGLVLAELGATDAQLDTYVAELLASLAMQVGVDRAVRSAVAGLGAAPVADAAASLQPLALLGPNPGEGPRLRSGAAGQAVALSGEAQAAARQPPPSARRPSRRGGPSDGDATSRAGTSGTAESAGIEIDAHRQQTRGHRPGGAHA